ncbi:MAG TPA: helix-turn-helix transcriptional regulator [Steroidobacteraceae bacterium]
MKELRVKAKLTQDQLADRLKRNQQYVDRVESGQQIPDPLECRQWATACGVTGWGFWWRLERRLKQHP